MSTGRRTRTADEPSPPASTQRHAYLASALVYDRPATPPSRYSLDAVTEVLVSGAAPVAARATSGSLAITCDDPWASTRHASLRRSFGRWLVEDLQSKNGTLVNGERITRHTLEDGDLIEVGHTTWWFRDLVAPAADRTLALDAAFLTLHAPLELALARAIDGLVAGLPVLVEGETGVGKERFVAAAHAASRRSGALVAVNCAALPAALVEGELFGHRRGAFSGATDERLGYIRSAHHGTLFLDEVGDMPTAAQAALLRSLAERSVTPVGDERPIPVDFTVISATHRDLAARVAAGSFRADLLARLRGVAIQIPPLRDRCEDIAAFIARIVARVAPAATFHPDAARRLLMASWPSNVRELEHVVAAALLRARSRPVALDDLEGITNHIATTATAPARESELSPEDTALRARLVAALQLHAGNISAVARDFDRDRKQIHRWLERLAIDPRDPR